MEDFLFVSSFSVLYYSMVKMMTKTKTLLIRRMLNSRLELFELYWSFASPVLKVHSRVVLVLEKMSDFVRMKTYHELEAVVNSCVNRLE